MLRICRSFLIFLSFRMFCYISCSWRFFQWRSSFKKSRLYLMIFHSSANFIKCTRHAILNSNYFQSGFQCFILIVILTYWRCRIYFLVHRKRPPEQFDFIVSWFILENRFVVNDKTLCLSRYIAKQIFCLTTIFII